MKTIFYKSSLTTALVASGLIMHLGTAYAASAGDFNTNIAVSSAACHIDVNSSDENPFTATANFSSTQVDEDASPGLEVPTAVKAVTVSSNCPITGITMFPSDASTFKGGKKAPNAATAPTSDGQWPMDFFWSNFEVYTGDNNEPDHETRVQIGNGGYFTSYTFTADDTPVIAAGGTARCDKWNDNNKCQDADGRAIEYITSAPILKYISSSNDLPAFTSTPNNAPSNTRSIGIKAQGLELTDGVGKQKFVAYVGAMFGTRPYSLDGHPYAGAVSNGEQVQFSRTVTVTAS